MSRRVSLGSHWSGSLFSRIYFAVFIFGLAGVSSKVYEYIITNAKFNRDNYFIGKCICHASHLVSRSMAYYPSAVQAHEITEMVQGLSDKLEEFHQRCSMMPSETLFSILAKSPVSVFVVANLGSLDISSLNLRRTTREHINAIMEALLVEARAGGGDLASVVSRFFSNWDGKSLTPWQQHAILDKTEYFIRESDDIPDGYIDTLRSLLLPITFRFNYLQMSTDITNASSDGASPQAILDTYFAVSANGRPLYPCHQRAMIGRMLVYGEGIVPERLLDKIASLLPPPQSRMDVEMLAENVKDDVANGIDPQVVLDAHFRLSANDRRLCNSERHDLLDRMERDKLLSESIVSTLRSVLPKVKRSGANRVGAKRHATAGRKSAKKGGVNF